MIIEITSATVLHVTAAYSNAVMVALLPIFSDVGQKLDLPVPHPITANDVEKASVLPVSELTASITTKSGWGFMYSFGYVTLIAGPDCFSSVEDQSELPRLFGDVKMSRDEAVEFARQQIKKLGIPLEQVFAEQEPIVTMPINVGTNVVPYYGILWPDPRSGAKSAHLEINGNRRRLERILLFNRNLDRPLPKISTSANYDFLLPVQNNPEYAQELLPIAMKSVDMFAERFSLPIPRPLITNHVERFVFGHNGGESTNAWPHAEIILTNGYRFIYRNDRVVGYYAPDNFFDSDQRPILLRDYVGTPSITDDEALTLARKTVAKFGYPTNLVYMMDTPPQIDRPKTTGTTAIPRLLFYWWPDSSGSYPQAKVEIEIDTSTKMVKAAYFDSKAFWGHLPDIKVPLLLDRH